MIGRLCKGGAFALALAMVLAFLGVAPALADEVAYTTDAALLTKVIVAPEGTDASQDTYTFTFAGDGTVREGNTENSEDHDTLYTGAEGEGVEQDSLTIKKGDVLPAIGPITLNGVELTAANSLSNGQSLQTVVSTPLADAFSGVTFPHAGVYTYRLTESSTSTNLTGDGYYVNASKSAYLLRVRVENDNSTQESANAGRTKVTGITVERVLNDDGKASTITKVDPTFPRTTDGKITQVRDGEVPTSGSLAGDNAERGRDVYGLSFTNEYVKGGEFMVKKLVDGDYADKTKYFPIKLQIHDEASTAENSKGCCVTYKIEGEGKDTTDNLDSYGEHETLTGVSGIPQASDSMAVFDGETGIATIEAELKEGSYIRITGVFGPHHSDYSDANGNKRMVLSTTGLLQGESYTITESYPGDYEPTGYVYVGEENIDPRSADSLSAAGNSVKQTAKKEDGTLEVTGTSTGSATTVFVVNYLSDDKVSPTGIIIDNLPYILMVVVPLGVFAAMFMAKRRGNAISQ